jgi:hypothetical protein
MKNFFVSIAAAVVAAVVLATSCPAQSNPDSAPKLAAPKLAVSSEGRAGDFPLATARGASSIYLDAQDFPVVRIAVNALAADIESVTKATPRVVEGAPTAVETAVLVGTLGSSRLIESLVAAKKLDVSGLSGAWESFVVATVPNPLPGVKRGLVIAGSDRRGTAYGVFTLSEAIGVSPWHWWADVSPRRRNALFVRAGVYRQGPPAVKYRGVFINDEDWGLQEWAEKNFEGGNGEVKDIGSKTYAKVFELLLRLKANYLWPAMHPSTKPFNFYPDNKVVADRYAIVMGSSHAEPMLRNNVGEWPREQAKMWNPVTNLPGILEYWEQRVRENGRYENADVTTPVPQRAGQVFDIDATKFAQSHDRGGAGWRVIDGLGPRGGAIAVRPQRDTPTLRSPQDIRRRALVAEYTVKTDYAGEVEVIVEALPTHPLTPAHEILAAVSVNDGEPVVVRFEQGKDDEDAPTWQANVLRNAMFGRVKLRVPGGTYKLKLWAADPGVVIQQITFLRGASSS